MEKEAVEKRVKEIISALLSHLKLPFESIDKTEVAGQQVLNIVAADTRDIIGPRGDTIRAIDHIVKKILEKEGSEEPLYLIDAGGFRHERIKELQQKVIMMAERAKSLQY